MRSSSVPTSFTVPADHRFGPLGLLAQHQNRLAERWPFFLNPAGIGDQQVGPAHQVDERHVALRLDQPDVRDVRPR